MRSYLSASMLLAASFQLTACPSSEDEALREL
jgi:hypothetical protein